MSKIAEIIPAASFEIVRDRIGEILADEILNQYNLTYDEETEEKDEELNITVYVERFLPVEVSEYPLINVFLSTCQLDNQTAVTQRNTVQYNIDCYCGSSNKSGETGDVLSKKKLHKMLRMCMAILNSPHYVRLGYLTPFINGRKVTGIIIRNEDIQAEKDSLHGSMGRLTLEVAMNESVEGVSPVLAEGYDTIVYLGESEKGYKYILNNS